MRFKTICAAKGFWRMKLQTPRLEIAMRLQAPPRRGAGVGRPPNGACSLRLIVRVH